LSFRYALLHWLVKGGEQPRREQTQQRGRSTDQYSSASKIVITRLVTDGSAGSEEW
jgi:hypothetical protein